MKITKATFDCTIAMPGYNNVKPGASEIILEPGETIEDAWTELNRRAQEWHRKEFPHCYSVPMPLAGINPSPGGLKHFTPQQLAGAIPTISKDKERIEIAIDNAETIEDLQILRSDSFENGLGANYVNKFNELNNGRPTNFTDGLE